ncbi:MAG: hypothetical protein WCO60_20095 [Verrucomicrobiota bacterium]
MSHVTKIDITFRDLEALESACKELGATLVRDVPTYNWYGKHGGDYPLPEGIKEEDLGKCTHVIRVPGVTYEVGVVAMPGGGFSILFDFWGGKTEGRGLQKVFCGSKIHPVMSDGEKIGEMRKYTHGMERLKQMYGIHAATRAAKAKGYSVQRKQVGGTIKLAITV